MNRNTKLLSKILSASMAMIMAITLCVCSIAESYAFSTYTDKSPFSSTGYSKYYHNKDQFDGSNIKHGVDVSEWQCASKCDYKKAKTAGVEFAIVRVAGRKYVSGSLFEDSDWTTHFEKARKNGIKTGIYIFSQAKTKAEAREEANYVCDLYEEGITEIYGSENAKEYLDLPIYMDYEFAGGSAGRIYKIKKTTATNCAKEFCETIKSRGYTPGIYASVSFLNGTIDGKTLGDSYDIWAAQYWNKNEFTGSYTKWQYSSSAKINGLVNSSGSKCSIDVNFWYVKESDFNPEPEPKKNISSEPEKEKPVITPTTLKTLKGGKKQFTATWTKKAKSKVDGYQIQYSRYSDMSYDLKKKATSYKTTSKTFKTNFRKYKYYVRIRTYKNIDGTTYYSKWSEKKTVKVK